MTKIKVRTYEYLYLFQPAQKKNVYSDQIKSKIRTVTHKKIEKIYKFLWHHVTFSCLFWSYYDFVEMFSDLERNLVFGWLEREISLMIFVTQDNVKNELKFFESQDLISIGWGILILRVGAMSGLQWRKNKLNFFWSSFMIRFKCKFHYSGSLNP